ncbi:ArsR family transcriptional regulator [Arthrobacter crusticola]|uniref:ArsR family transcriptional regulator n=1 Tax=Arthrobacter crusticola TaxID=2547960 RepID=A0A4R5U3E8_9MICC|nr:helix-turn-helix domain-containing protein [Arthrobacter crusticola]TDK28128.1 ArsR family transcriptional regulator [Arthrobacter crusticola]
MISIQAIDDRSAAVASLDPIKSRLLEELAEPGSASSLAAKVRLPRQKINYHLRALEAVGLVSLVEERRRGNMTERLVQATAASYVISPSVLDPVAPDPARFSDRFSAFWLLALASRMVGELGQLIAGAAKADRQLPTFGIDGDLSFRSAADRTAFVEELGTAVARLVDTYSSPADTPGGRRHRLIVALHPTPKESTSHPTSKEKHSEH